jgi:serine protease Do
VCSVWTRRVSKHCSAAEPVILPPMPRSVVTICFGLVAVAGSILGFLAGGGGHTSGQMPPVTIVAPSFADVVERVNPAVVHVTVVEGSGRSSLGHLRDLQGRESPRRGEGSGFVVDADGYILTNHHLVASPNYIRIRFADKREASATLVGVDTSTDLALLKVSLSGLTAVRLGDSDRLRVGEWVCAIGNPYLFDHSVTVGVVSSKGRKIWDASFDAYIQTDAAINPGNSGGPLINAAGEAIGINSAVSTEGQGIGFAIPINAAREVLEQLRTRGKVSRGYLGIQLHELDPELQKLVGLTEPGGAVVLDVLKESAAEAAGLKRYDVITAVSGERIDDGDRLVRAIAAKPPGSRVTLTVFRDGHKTSVEARLTERATEVSPSPPGIREEASAPTDPLGLSVTELSPSMRADLGVPADQIGVVVNDVVGLSPGADVLDHGDLIVEVNRKPTPDLAAYRRVVSSLKAGDVAWLFVYRTRPPGSILAKLDVEAKPGGER